MDFKQPYPENKPFKCGWYWHLNQSGGCCAIYSFIGALTNGGATSYHTSIRKASDFFELSYGGTRRIFRALTKMGWLRCESESELDRYWYVPHDQWAINNPGKCAKRELISWQYDTDPLVGKIHALADGKIRIFESHVAAIRKVASDDDFLNLFSKNLLEAKEKQRNGEYTHTSTKSCFYNTIYLLKNLKKQCREAAAER